MKPPACLLCRGSVKKSQVLEAGNLSEEGETGDGEQETADATLAAMEDITVNVSSSKINAALKELLRIRRDLPADKVIASRWWSRWLLTHCPGTPLRPEF